MDPFEDLEADHRVIDKLLTALEAATPQNTDASFFERVVEFVQRFADGCHHLKEEDHLFPVLVLSGVQQDMGPVGVMLEEHRTGRCRVGQMVKLLGTGNLEALCAEGRAYAKLMRDHIMKEEHVLFMIGRQMVRQAGIERIRRGFESIHDGEQVREHYDEMASALCAQVGVTPVATM